MQSIIHQINQLVKLTAQAEEDLLNSFKPATFKKDEIILRHGQTCKYLFFLLEGTIRTFFLTDQREITTWIYRDGTFLTAWSSYLEQKKSFESIQAIQDCKVAAISKSSLEDLYNRHACIERFGRRLAETQIAGIDEYSKGYMFLSAEDKYNNLLAAFPDVENRANLGYIASMLGISQETLSRLRKKRT